MSEEIDILDKFKGYGFNGRGKKILRGIIGDNVFIIKENKDDTYYFIKISKNDFIKASEKNFNDLNIEYINFNQDFFNENEDKFIKSLIKQQLKFDKVYNMPGNDFKKLNASDCQLKSIKTISPEEIKDIQPEPVPEKKDEEELMGDDDEERMNDDEEEEEEEKQRKEIEERKRKIKEEDAAKQRLGSSFGRDEEEKPDAFEDNQVFLDDEYDKEKEFSDDERELFKQAKKMNDRQLNNQLVQYKQDFKIKPERKKNRGKMPKEHSDFFNELRGRYGFKLNNEGSNAGQAYLRVGDDIIFVKRLTNNTPGYSKYRDKEGDHTKDKNFMIAIVNKSDFPKLDSDNEDVKARFFNFSLDYYKKNKDKFSDAIEDKKFIFDQDLQKINDDYNFEDYFLNKERLEKLNIIPKNFNYRKVFSNNNQNNQLINAGHTPNGEELKALIKYNNNSDSLLKLIVSLSENNKGEVDFKEIGEIQDLNGDITNLYSDMQDLKSKINSSNNAEEKERLLIKYNKKRLNLEDLIKKYSKEAYRLSTLKKKKATMATHKYLMNKLNKLN